MYLNKIHVLSSILFDIFLLFNKYGNDYKNSLKKKKLISNEKLPTTNILHLRCLLKAKKSEVNSLPYKETVHCNTMHHIQNGKRYSNSRIIIKRKELCYQEKSLTAR